MNLIATLLSGIIFFILAIFALYSPMSENIYWYLYATKWLQKNNISITEYYLHFKEMNLPTIVIFNYIPLFLSHRLGTAYLFTAKVCYLLAITLPISLAWCRLSYQIPIKAIWLLLTGFIFFTYPLGAEPHDIVFWEREYFIAALLLPTLFAKGRKNNKTKAKAQIHGSDLIDVVLTTIACTLKPHYILVLFALALLRSKTKRLLWLAAITFCSLYYTCIFLVFHGFKNVALDIIETYQSLNIPILWVLAKWETCIVAIPALIINLIFNQRKKIPEAFWLTCIALFVVLIQSKGWRYHYFTVFVLAFNLWFIFLNQLIFKKKFYWASALAFILICTTTFFHIATKRPSLNLISRVKTQLKSLPNANSYLVLSTSPQVNLSIAMQNGYEWKSKYFHLWYLPHFFQKFVNKEKLIPYAKVIRSNSSLNQKINDLVTELETGKPDILGIDQSQNLFGMALNEIDLGYNGPANFNLLQMLLSQQRFRQTFQRYRFVTAVESIYFYHRLH